MHNLQNEQDPSTTFQERIWQALGRLIENRYQRYIGFTPTLLAEMVGENIHVTRKGDLLIPIQSEGHFMGSLRIKEGGTLQRDEIFQIQEMLHQIGKVLLDLGARSASAFKEETIKVKRQRLQIVGGRLVDRRKIAMDLHTELNTSSFIVWEDLAQGDFGVHELKELCETVIYIQDFHSLKRTDKEKILELMELVKTSEEEGPHFILGATEVHKIKYQSMNSAIDSAKDSAIDTSMDTSKMEQAEKNAYAFQTTNMAGLGIDEAILQYFQNSIVFVDQLPKEYLLLKEVLAMLL